MGEVKKVKSIEFDKGSGGDKGAYLIITNNDNDEKQNVYIEKGTTLLLTKNAGVMNLEYEENQREPLCCGNAFIYKDDRDLNTDELTFDDTLWRMGFVGGEDIRDTRTDQREPLPKFAVSLLSKDSKSIYLKYDNRNQPNKIIVIREW